MGLIGSRSIPSSVKMCGRVGRVNRCVGESPVYVPFLLHEVFPAICTSAFFSSLLSGSARPHVGYGHFAEVYSQLQQYKSEQPLGAVSGHRFLSHWAHAGIVRMGNAAAQGEGHRASLATSAWPLPLEGAPWLEQSVSPKKTFFTEPARGATGRDPAAEGRPAARPG